MFEERNLRYMSKEDLHSISIKQANKEKIVEFAGIRMTIPKFALYGKINGIDFFVDDYKQFNTLEGRKSIWIKPQGNYPYRRIMLYTNTVIISWIYHAIKKHNMFNTICLRSSDIDLFYIEDTRRGKVKSYKSVKEDYFTNKWFLRD